MNEERFNSDVRRFLKKVGITSQGEIEQAVQAAVESGRIADGAVLKAHVQLRVEGEGSETLLDTAIDGDIRLD